MYLHSLKTFLSFIINNLYPSICPVCGNKSDVFSISPFCSACWAEIKIYEGPSCSICALPFISEKANKCGSCYKKQPLFLKAISYGLYDGMLKEAISRFKFHGERRFAKPLGRFLQSLELPAADAVIPVPMTKKELIKRGFNQSVLIARAISEKNRVPLLINNLFKVKETVPQVGLSAPERQKNLSGAFMAKGNLKDKRIILLDDVMTTGATASECTKALLKAGAEEVTVLTLARAGML